MEKAINIVYVIMTINIVPSKSVSMLGFYFLLCGSSVISYKPHEGSIFVKLDVVPPSGVSGIKVLTTCLMELSGQVRMPGCDPGQHGCSLWDFLGQGAFSLVPHTLWTCHPFGFVALLRKPSYFRPQAVSTFQEMLFKNGQGIRRRSSWNFLGEHWDFPWKRLDTQV